MRYTFTLFGFTFSFRFTRFTQFNLLSLLLLLFLSLIWIYPFFWVIGSAFKTQPEMFLAGVEFWPEELLWENFERAWVEANFDTYFINTVIYSVSATVIAVVLSSTTGYVLARYEFPGKRILFRVLLATLFIPIATIIIPQFNLVRELGLLNSRLGVILALAGGGGALYVLLFKGYFESIPEELFDSAKIDGAGFLQTFWLVVPLARPIIATVVIFQFLQTWNEFNIPLVFTLANPELRNLAVGMYAFQGEHTFDWPGFAAGTVISVVPVLLVFFIFQGYFVRGLQGAVKG
ncbi:MAG: carbohydrate ABC transporter permease [Anaerolineales bacterium]